MGSRTLYRFPVAGVLDASYMRELGRIGTVGYLNSAADTVELLALERASGQGASGFVRRPFIGASQK